MKQSVNNLRQGFVLEARYEIQEIAVNNESSITYIVYDREEESVKWVEELYPRDLVERNEETAFVRPKERKTEEFGKEKRRFLSEAACQSGLNFPVVVKVYEYFESYGTVYVVKEALEGKLLRSYLKENDGAFTADEVRRFGCSMCELFENLHLQGIICRNLTADSLFVCADGEIKLTNLNAAFLDDEYETPGKRYSSFGAPELYVNMWEEGPWTDIYALGAVLYYMLTGEQPQNSIERVRSDNLEDPMDINDDIPAELNDVVMIALEVDPKERFKTVKDFSWALEHFSLQKRKKGRIVFIGIVGIAAVVVLAAVIFWCNGRRMNRTSCVKNKADVVDTNKENTGTEIKKEIPEIGIEEDSEEKTEFEMQRESWKSETETLRMESETEKTATEEIKLRESENEAGKTELEETEQETEETETEETETEETETEETETEETETEETETEETDQETVGTEEEETERETEDISEETENEEEQGEMNEANQKYKDRLAETYASSLGVYVASKDGVSLMESPNSDQFSITVPKNALLAAMETEVSQDTAWYRVDYYGISGWVEKDKLTEIGSPEDTANIGTDYYISAGLTEEGKLYEKPSETSEQIAGLSYGTEVNFIVSQDGWGEVNYQGQIGWIRLEDISVYLPWAYYYVNTDGSQLTIRSEADINSESIGMVNYGTVCKVEAFQSGWGKITAGSSNGWVNMKYMTPCKEDTVIERYESDYENSSYDDYRYEDYSYTLQGSGNASSGGTNTGDDELNWQSDDELSWSDE